MVKRGVWTAVTLVLAAGVFVTTETLGLTSFFSGTKEASLRQDEIPFRQGTAAAARPADNLEKEPVTVLNSEKPKKEQVQEAIADGEKEREQDRAVPPLTQGKKSGSAARYQTSGKQEQPAVKKGIILRHTISKGETLYSIARIYYESKEGQQFIIDANGLAGTSDIKAGTALKIPDPDFLSVYKVKQGDTLFSIASHFYSRSKVLSYFSGLNSITNPSVDVKAGAKVMFPQTHHLDVHIIQPGETAYSIMDSYYKIDTYIEAVKEFNHLSGSSLQAGTTLYIPNFFKLEGKTQKVHEGRWIEVSKSKHLVTLYDGDRILFQEKAATGKSDDLTPTGTFQVIAKLENPWYSPKGITGGSPDNPLGTRWLGLSVPGTSGEKYGIHGTNNPSSIGKDVSLGCIRLDNRNVEWLFDRVPLGTKVVIKE
ncbi:L,D-transpeptidase family protein [Bacillus marinisedimentorum]|uniref:L,D-transpeptidase family protein n=1 Tax=Bacillus marinisedimentorum TaxID=1821260 RepID=UPI001472115B